MFCFALIILLEELFYFNEELQSEPSVKESLTSSTWEDVNDDFIVDETRSRPWILPLDQWISINFEFDDEAAAKFLAVNSNSDAEAELDPGTTRDFPDPFGNDKETEIASKSDEVQARFQSLEFKQ